MASIKELLLFPDNKVRLVLIGKTGVGKSSAGNTIMGSEMFPSVRGFKSGTEKCNWHTVDHEGLTIERLQTNCTRCLVKWMAVTMVSTTKALRQKEQNREIVCLKPCADC